MVSWRGMRPVLVTLLLIATALAISAITFFGNAPFQFLADLRARVTQADPTPTSTPLFQPTTPELAVAVIPHYPAVVIVQPGESVFAETAQSPTAELLSEKENGTLSKGNCIMNDGSIISLLPDCVVGDESAAPLANPN